ncbi:MAG TPA: hypothetical protein VMW48_13885 [Vicinamibacterales bacterium]|nr:hypothetical protein [Vicinamibacterales bacterium]
MTAVAWLGTVAVAVAGAAAGRGAQAIDPNTVRARLQIYLSSYERDLSTVIAEERFTQWPHRPGVGSGRDKTRPRRLRSDVAFVSLPGDAGWLGYRDVRTVNDKAVKRSGLPLEELLRLDSTDARDRAMALLLEGARHNLGAPRTINLPSLPLELLHVRNQGRFVIVGTYAERVDDCDALRLEMEETARPTLIQRPEGGDMPSKVSAWVEPETGRLCRAEVRTKDAQLGAWFEALVRVEFSNDPGVGLMVPVKLYEVFFDPPRNRGDGEATYSNYRRFTTSGRVVPGPDR